MPKVELLCGMIASGKSTYARKRADEGAIVIAHDDITRALHCRDRYEQDLREFYRMVEWGIAGRALLAGRDVVVDRTHLTRESRSRWVEFTRRHNIELDAEPGSPRLVRCVAVVFPRQSALVHAQRRYQDDPRGRPFSDWLKVALHHQEQADAEPLSDDERFDQVIRIWMPYHAE